MTGEFVREERYIVFKMSDLGNSLKGDEIRRLAREYAEHRQRVRKKPLECVVVEKDWPEYEPTWRAIEARVNGAQPAPSVPREAIEKMLTQLMDIAASNGANSVSMPDEYVEVAAWLYGIPAQPAPTIAEQDQINAEAAIRSIYGAQPVPSINEGVRKVTLDFRWESEAQHHIPTIEIEFEPVSPESPNDAKGWKDRDRIASMLSPEAKP